MSVTPIKLEIAKDLLIKSIVEKDKNTLIQHFKDDATAFNNLKKTSVEGKGVLNNRISEYIFKNLDILNWSDGFYRKDIGYKVTK